MKKIIFILSIVMIANAAMAQHSSYPAIPQKVTSSFVAKFPTAQVKSWKENKSGYVASFFIEKRKYLAFYSADANWLRTETKISRTKQLPETVNSSFHKTEYAAWRINAMKEIETPAEYTYLIHVDNSNHLAAEKPNSFKEHWLLYFSKDGKMIKKEKLNDHHS